MMYDSKLKCWVSANYAPDLVKQCLDAAHTKDPEVLFIIADHYLSEGRKGNHTADAVYAMETAAKQDYVDAALGMGQMYHHGWGVHKSQKKAIYWYEIAAKLGSSEAEAYITKLRRRRKAAILSTALTFTAAAVGLALVLLLPKLFPDSPAPAAPSADAPPEITLPDGVLVGEDTELVTVTSARDFSTALADIIKENDTELVISGEQSTNRLILRFEGSGIDLSAFPAATVIANDNSKLVIIQFTSEAEAKACLEALKKMTNVKFAETDEYVDYFSSTSPQPTANTTKYQSQYTGFDYYSWGATFLELDQMVAWTMTQPTQEITVAVVDTGTQYHPDFGDRLLPGVDMVDPSAPNGWGDTDGHGTNVGGIILECTQGLDVNVLPIRIEFGLVTSVSIISLAIEHAIDEKVDVLNLSLGGGCFDAIHSATERAIQEGLVVVIAAGNDSIEVESNGICPAHITDGITVSACDSTGTPAYFTNYGNCIDVCAPGYEIVGYYLNGGFAACSGTSQAAPHISAMAAIILANAPHKSIEQIEKYLGDYSINPGDADYYGDGIPCGRYFAGD